MVKLENENVHTRNVSLRSIKNRRNEKRKQAEDEKRTITTNDVLNSQTEIFFSLLFSLFDICGHHNEIKCTLLKITMLTLSLQIELFRLIDYA